jgi:diketogulonate reductase-like aldo/keto reductase
LPLYGQRASISEVVAIPESGAVTHVQENAIALSLTLTPQELETLDAALPLSGR